MATTLSAVILKGRTAHIFHVGDSRVYRLRAGDLEQLTRDHRKQAYLTHAVGMDLDLEVDYLVLDVVEGDVFAMTTDGVHDVVGFQGLRERVRKAAADGCLEATARAVVDVALERGSTDNASCLLVRIDSAPTEDIDEAHRRLTRQTIPPALTSGNRIDGYRVVRTIAAGTRSHVYLVEDAAGHRLVLKTPSESFAEDAVYLDGFVREEWIGGRVDHPGVMKILPRPADSRFLYYLAEHIEGRTLRQWMLDHPRPPIDEVRRLVEAMAKALRAFQRLQMVHRDLKPENVMIDRDGAAKIIDFGTVHVQGFDELSSAVRETWPVGSVGYCAPECLLGHPATHAADIYALGVVAYEMLTGTLPHKAPLRRDANAYVDRPYIPLERAGRTDLPKWVDLALAKATAPNPAHRYEALSELVTDLMQPNPALLRRVRSAPLLEKNPTLFWQIASGVLAGLLILSLAVG